MKNQKPNGAIAFVSGAKGGKAAASLHPDGVNNVESFAGIEWKF
jgi:hypothetical protein